jgi:hypothetical protein
MKAISITHFLPMQNLPRSLAALFAGMLIVIILSVGSDVLLEKTIWPKVPLLVALLYRTVYAAIGGFLTAMLSPSHQMRNVYTLAILGSILGILGALANWGRPDNWYPIALVIFSFAAVVGGGKLFVARNQKTAPAKAKATKSKSKSKRK